MQLNIMVRKLHMHAYKVTICIVYVTGSAKTLHSRTSDFTTLTSHNFEFTNDIALKFLDTREQ